MIHWELCKRLKFGHTTKSYVYKLEYVQENDMYIIICDFKIQTDYQISARRTKAVN